MTGAKDWFSYQACYADPAGGGSVALARAWPADPEEQDEPAAPAGQDPPAVVDPPCPALESPGQGTAIVTGVVRSADARAAPLVGEVVKVGPQESEFVPTAITDETGRYTISGVAPGRHDVMVFTVRHMSKQRCVSLRGGAVVAVDLTVREDLEPSEIIELGGAAKSPPTPPEPRK